MEYMEATKKNKETVNKIIKIFKDSNFTVKEAYSILDFTRMMIGDTSKVGDTNVFIIDD